eukprot:4846458-Prymnesium_polylepis.1
MKLIRRQSHVPRRILRAPCRCAPRAERAKINAGRDRMRHDLNGSTVKAGHVELATSECSTLQACSCDTHWPQFRG